MELIDVLSSQMKVEGRDEKQYDLEKAVEYRKSIMSMETKANEVMNTGNTGYGAELIP